MSTKSMANLRFPIFRFTAQQHLPYSKCTLYSIVIHFPRHTNGFHWFDSTPMSLLQSLLIACAHYKIVIFYSSYILKMNNKMLNL